MTNEELLEMLVHHYLVHFENISNGAAFKHCYIMDDEHNVIHLDPAQKQQLEEQGLIEPLPPMIPSDTPYQWHLSGAGWDRVFSSKK